MASHPSAPPVREREGEEAGPEGAAEEGSGDALGSLPGVVNDLPEVAPHEWIYLMS